MGVQRIKNVNFLLLPLSTIAIAIELSSSTGRKHPDDADVSPNFFNYLYFFIFF